MELPAAPWEEVEQRGPSSASKIPSSVSGLVSSLSTQRKSRELGLQLRCNLRNISAEYCHLRKHGLRKLSSFLEVVISAEDLTALFCESQLYPELQIVPVLFTNSLCSPREMLLEMQDPFAREPPIGLREPSSEEEVIMALRLLEGCCVLDPSSRSLATRHGVAKDLLERLDVDKGSTDLLESCFDALLATLLDCPSSLQLFFNHGGVSRISHVIKSKKSAKRVKLKGAEFLTLLVDQILVSPEELPLKREDVLQEAAEHLGTAAAALLRSGASFPGELPTSGALVTRAQHIIDSVASIA